MAKKKKKEQVRLSVACHAWATVVDGKFKEPIEVDLAEFEVHDAFLDDEDAPSEEAVEEVEKALNRKKTPRIKII